MKGYPIYYKSEEELEEAISRPTKEVVKMMSEIDGDIILLGVAGKIGVSLARMAKRACNESGINKRIIGVSRFSSEKQREYLEESGIETIKGDLVDQEFINSLPEVKNVFFLAGMKFGTEGNEAYTWAMNSFLPGLVVQKFKQSRIVAFSTGCVYPLVEVSSGGSVEIDRVEPIGEYAQSCLGRERIFEYGSLLNNTPIALIRLFYSVEMRYGLLVDVGLNVYNEEPIDLTMGYVNVIWQGDANSLILQSLKYCESPAKPINISGQEILSVRETAEQFGKLMNKKVNFIGEEAETALLGNGKLSYELMGEPKINANKLIEWTSNWIQNENVVFGKPTHYEVRDGNY